jgi:hypothetical protein
MGLLSENTPYVVVLYGIHQIFIRIPFAGKSRRAALAWKMWDGVPMDTFILIEDVHWSTTKECMS